MNENEEFPSPFPEDSASEENKDNQADKIPPTNQLRHEPSMDTDEIAFSKNDFTTQTPEQSEGDFTMQTPEKSEKDSQIAEQKPPQSQEQTPAQFSEETDKKEESDALLWFVFSEGNKLGPFTTSEIEQNLQAKKFAPDFFAWRAGMDDWYRFRDIAEFRDAIRKIAPEEISISKDSLLKEQLICPNCFAHIPVTATKCPACNIALKRKTLPLREGIQKSEPWHIRLSLLGGAIMLIALLFPWLDMQKAGSKTGFAIAASPALFFLALLITIISLQNILTQTKRNLSILLASLAGLIFAVSFAVSVLQNTSSIKTEVKQLTGFNLDASGQFEESALKADKSDKSDNPSLVGTGVLLYIVGALIALAALTLPSIYALIEKPVAGIALIIFGIIAFIFYLQILNGSAYKLLIKLQLELRGFDVVKVQRVDAPEKFLKPQVKYRIFATKTYKTKNKIDNAQNKTDADAASDKKESKKKNAKVIYYFGEKTINLGSFAALCCLKLSELDKTSLCLYPEFAENTAETKQKE